MTEHTYEIWQRDIMVVSVTADDLDEARREILHYLVQYGQDGPCSIRGTDMEAFMAGIKDNPPRSGQPKTNIADLIRSIDGEAAK